MTGHSSPGGRRVRLRRGSLTADRIVSESLRLLDENGVSGLSLPKLGRALGADPTAVYRHFASRDDLLLAIADRLIEELTDVRPNDCWVDTLAHVAHRLRRSYLAHPAAASLSAYRTTRRPAEMRAVDVIIGAILLAGFRGSEAAVIYRAYADFLLSFAGGEASFRSLGADVQDADRTAWENEYLSVDPETHPNIGQLRVELAAVDDDQIFETALDLVLTGIRRRAPNTCGCHHHGDRSDGATP